MKIFSRLILLSCLTLSPLPSWSADVRQICVDTQKRIDEQKARLEQLSAQKVTLLKDVQDYSQTLSLQVVREATANRPPREAIGILTGHVRTLANVLQLYKAAVNQYNTYLPKAQELDGVIDAIITEFKGAVAQCNVDPAMLQKWQTFSDEQKAHVQETEQTANSLAELLRAHEDLKLELESEIKRLQ